MTVVVKPVSNKTDLRDFLAVPFETYRGDPNWVAPLFLERMDHLNPKKNPYFEHAEAQLFVAYRDGRPVGRISAQVDRLRLEYHPDQTGQFGFFDSENSDETAAALFQAASGWLAARGMKQIQGPFSFSINDEIGLLVDGFNHPPNMMMAHGRAYYPGLVERAGFTKVKDVIAYRNMDRGDYSPLLRKITDRALRSGDVTLRPLDKKEIKRDIRIIMDIFNDAWQHNWGFVPFTQAELNKLAADLKMLVTGEYVVIASYKGEPAAFAVTLPNLNEWIAGLNGKLLPFGWARLIPKVIAKKPKSIRMPLMGVRRSFHDSLAGSALAAAMIDRVRSYHISRGVMECEMSWILEDNKRMRHVIEEVGGDPYKTYRIYEKAI